jgi:hypothetical protein
VLPEKPELGLPQEVGSADLVGAGEKPTLLGALRERRELSDDAYVFGHAS